MRARGAVCGVLLLALAIAAPGLRADEDAGPPPEPTPEETLMVEYVNRARTDPGGEARRIRSAAPELVKKFTRLRAIDLDRFVEEMEAAPPVPPLVFDLRLLVAARGHARYLALNGVTGHSQEPGKPGFTGRSPAERARAAGFPSGVNENASLDYWDVQYGYLAYLIDFKRGAPDGMRPGRGHRKFILDAKVTVMASGRHEQEPEVGECQLFGSGEARRYVGGVVYADANGNGFYDVGEGAGGVEIRVEGKAAGRTWSAGAYALPIPGGEAVPVEAIWGEYRFTKLCPATEENVEFDIGFPTGDVLRRLDERIAGLPPASAATVRNRKRLIEALNLHFDTRRLTLDDERARLLRERTAEPVRMWEAARDEVRRLLADGPIPEAIVRAKAHLRAFKATRAEPFFDDAQRLATVQKRLASVLADPARAGARKCASALRQLAKVREKLVTEEWRSHADQLRIRLGGE